MGPFVAKASIHHCCLEHWEARTYGTNTPTESLPYKATAQAALHHGSPKNCPIPGQTAREEASAHFPFCLRAGLRVFRWERLPVKRWSSFAFPARRDDVIVAAEDYRASATLAVLPGRQGKQTHRAAFVSRRTAVCCPRKRRSRPADHSDMWWKVMQK